MNLNNPTYYNNRELSWLAFNERVLEEALDKTNPLMERLKFLAITASNLDEFFMVRVSSLWEQEPNRLDITGRTPARQLTEISQKCHEIMAKQYQLLKDRLLPALAKEGAVFLEYSQLNEKDRPYAANYFEETLFKVLTPMAIDQSRPFPVLNNRAIILFIELENGEESTEPLYAMVQLPTVLPRMLALPSDNRYILLEDVMLAHIGELFPGHAVNRVSFIRVTRNSDLDIDEEEMEDLMDEMERSIKRRRWGDPVRMEVSRGLSDAALGFLQKALDLDEAEIYPISGPLDLTVWMRFASNKNFSRLRNKPMPPQPSAAFIDTDNLFDVIKKRDVILHHPYMSFDPVIRFVREAAADPDVLAIKQTLYRVSGQSPIINALMQAAENGKQVTVIVELRARFDEENNINWAKKLDQAGVHVVYGLVGLKTHCKVCLVVRREVDGIRRYAHLSTGNYNDTTAKVYTDTGYFTCREDIGQDSSILFNALTGYSRATDWQTVVVAPVSMRAEFINLIETEIRNREAGLPAAITAKMNSLSDIGIIQALYRASMAGVKIRLLVRGMCCLKTGIPGISENIEVSSIVDRFLEHSRIYIFENGGKPKIFLSSADWMPRNLDRRVEVLFPIEDAGLQKELTDMLEISLSDNVKRRVQHPDGQYKKINRRDKTGYPAVQSQLTHYEMAVKAYAKAQKNAERETFRLIHK
jgi:polyphosphate kinase